MAAKTVYVRIGGNDGNSGLTPALAKLTLSGANAIATSGDTVDIGAGTWTEEDQISKKAGVIYKGAGMFLTTIIGLPYVDNTGLNPVWRDMKIIFTNVAAKTYSYGASSTNVELTRVYLDLSLWVSQGIALFGSGTNATRRYSQCVIMGQRANFGVFQGGNGIAKVYNCVFSQFSAGQVFYALPSVNNVWYVKNNIFDATVDRFPGAASGIFTPGDYSIHDHNCLSLNVSLTNLTLDATDFVANPLFKDVAGGDFRVPYNSPVAGRGTSNLP